MNRQRHCTDFPKLVLALVVQVFAIGLCHTSEWQQTLLDQCVHIGLEQAGDQTVATELTISQDLDDLETGEALNVRGKRQRLGTTTLEWREWPDKNRQKLSVALRWEAIAKGEHYLHLGDDYAQVLLDGEVLAKTVSGLWVQPGRASLRIAFDRGKHQILALPQQAQRNPPACTIIAPAALDTAEQALQQRLNDLTNADNQKLLERLLRDASRHDAPNGNAIARGFIELALQRWRPNPQDPQDDLRKLFEQLIDQLPHDERGRFGLVILERSGPDLLQLLLQDQRRIDRLADSVADQGQISQCVELMQLSVAGLPADADDKTRSNLARSIMQRIRTLTRHAAFTEARKLCLLVQSIPRLNEKYVNDVAQTDNSLALYQRTAVRLIADPDAERVLRSFEAVLQRDPTEPSTITTLFELLRDNSGLQLRQDQVVQSLGNRFATMLQRQPSLAQALRSHASERLADRINSASQRGDIEELEAIIVRFGSLIDSRTLHRQLLDECIDRADFDRARVHAHALLRSGERKDRRDGLAALLCIEDALNMPIQARTRVPERMHIDRLRVGGKDTSLLGLQQQFIGEVVNNRARGGPGSVIGILPLPSSHPDELDPDSERPAWRQPYEPRLLGETLALGDTRSTWAIDSGVGKVLWQDTSPRVHQYRLDPVKHSAHPLAFAGGTIITLRSSAGGGKNTLQAFDSHGVKAWDFEDLNQHDWEPLAAPREAFGSCFVLLRDAANSDTVQIALGRLDSSNGALTAVYPLDSIDRGRVGSQLYFDTRFVVADDGLYGYTGSGVVFKLDPETLRPDWVRSLALRSTDNVDDPPGFIGVYGPNVVCYLPSVKMWYALTTMSGTVRWSWRCDNLRYIHSRASESELLVSIHDDRGSRLLRVDPANGTLLWRRAVPGEALTGEGCLVAGIAYLPVPSGILRLDLASGEAKPLLLTPGFTPNQVRAHGSLWTLLGEQGMALLQADDKWTPRAWKIPEAPAIRIDRPHHEVSFSRFDELWFEQALPSIWRDPSFLPLETAGYSLVTDRHSQAVGCLREGFRDEQGVYRAPELIWHTPYPNHQRIDDRLLSWQGDRLRVIKVPEQQELCHIQLNQQEIKSACLAGDEIAYQVGRTVFIQGLTDDEVQQSVQIDNRSRVEHLHDDILICRRGRNEYRAYSRTDGSEQWTCRAHDGHFTSIDSAVLLQGGSKLTRIDIRNGKTTDMDAGRNSGRNWFWHDAENVYLEPDLIAPIGNLKQKKKLNRVVVDDRGHGVLLVDKENLRWHAADGDLDLSDDQDLIKEIKQIDRRRQISVHDRGKVVLLLVDNTIYIFDKKWGLEYSRRLAHDRHDHVETVLNHSFLVKTGDHLSLMRARPDQLPMATETFAKPTDPNALGWPQQGWLPIQEPEPGLWFGRNGQKPERQYRYQFGHDDRMLYLRFLISDRSDAQVDTRLEVLATWFSHDNDIGATWNMDTAKAASRLPFGRSAIVSWKQRLDADTVAYHLMMPRADRDPNYRSGEIPRLHLQISERINGRLAGSYRIGGPTRGQARRQPADPIRQESVLTEAGYQAREQLYAEAKAFFPQGSELAAWARHHRLLHGREKTETFLQDMLSRTAGSDSVAGVLSVQALEAFEQLRCDPTTPDVRDNAYLMAIQAVCDRLDQQASGHGINAARRKRGLSVFFALIQPGEAINEQALGSIRLDRGRSGLSFRLDAASPICDPQNGPFAVLLPLGLFSGRPPQSLDRVDFGDIGDGAELIGMGVVSPGQTTYWVHPDGLLQNGFKTNKKNQLRYGRGPGGVLPLARDYDLPTIDIGELDRQQNIAADDLLLGLRNLPADSRIATNLIDAYREAAGKQGLDDVELYRIALERVPEQFGTVRELGLRLLDLAKKQYPQDLPRRYEQVHEILRNADVPRNLQRRLFMETLNVCQDQGRLAMLGPFDTEELVILDAPPEPERSAEPLRESYDVGGKSQRFRIVKPNDWNNLRRQGRDQVGYLALPFRLRERAKVFCYLSGSSGKASIWIDGQAVCDEEAYDGELVVSQRLEEGEHLLLIRMHNHRGWFCQLHLGDSWGIPLPELSLGTAIVK